MFGAIIDVRRGEVLITSLMLGYYYLLLVTYYFLKPARDSLFLTQLGSEQLPVVYMMIALLVVPIIALYTRASRRLKLYQLVNVTTLFIIVNLALLRFLLEFTHPAVFYAFYVWTSIFGALTSAQFWLLANAVYDATEAKRIFVLLGLGGILGAFTGGEVTHLVVENLGVATENLLYFCMALLTVCVALVNMVARLRAGDGDVSAAPRRSRRRDESYRAIVRTIKSSRHLMLIVGIIAMTMATTSFIDYQFKTVSVQSFGTAQDLTSFLGRFYGRLSLLALLVQLIVGYRYLRWFGVGGAILLLPSALVMGASWLLIAPGLVAAVLLRGTQGVFSYSIDKTGRELLFLPVPLDVKERTKVFIDIFVDRWFRGFAGALLLLLVGVFGMSVRSLSWVVMGMLAVWLSFVWQMRREYVNTFRKAIERREIDLSEIRHSITDSSTLQTLKAALSSSNPRQLVYALDMLQGVDAPDILEAVRPLLRHASPEIRAGAVRLARTSGDERFREDMPELLHDPDPAVQRDVLHYTCQHAASQPLEMLKGYVCGDDYRLRAAALSCIAAYGGKEERGLVDTSIIEQMMRVEGELGVRARSSVAEVLGAVDRPELRPYLITLLGDPDPLVVREALCSVGTLADRDLIPHLLDRLADNHYRRPARSALAAFGEGIVGTLGDYITDRSLAITVRANLCRVLKEIPTQKSADTLITILPKVEPQLRYYVLKALNSLRARYSDLRFGDEAVNCALIEESESYYATLEVLRLNDHPDTPGCRLLERALGEKIDSNLERIFRLLGLRYAQNDIHGAYIGITGDDRRLRANAVEFLDNVLKKEIKKYLFPIVDNVPDDFKIRRGHELFGMSFASREEGIRHLVEGADPWLASCAIHALGSPVPPTLRAAVEGRKDDPDPVVRETARRALVA